MSPRMLRPSRFLSITVMFCVLVTLTGCPRGKDLPSRIDNGFEVTAGSTLLGAVFADTDGWTAYSNISGDPVAVWNDFAKRSRSFTFRSIGDALVLLDIRISSCLSCRKSPRRFKYRSDPRVDDLRRGGPSDPNAGMLGVAAHANAVLSFAICKGALRRCCPPSNP